MAVKRGKRKAAPAPKPKPEDKALVAAPPKEGALVDFWPHPITSEGRRQSAIVVPEWGAPLAEVLRDLGVGLGGGPVEARLDGLPVPRDQWARRVVLPGQIVEARAVVQGGGDSDPFEIVFTIAAITLSLYLGPAGLSLGAAALTAGATVIGGLVVNALFPVESPDAGTPGRPVYSLHGGANRARPYEPAMLALGTHRVFPDLAAQEYTQFIGDDQFLFQLFDFGIGDLDISEIKIGETLLSALQDVTQEKKLPGQAVTLLAGDVHTSLGGTLELPAAARARYEAGSGADPGYGEWTSRTSEEKARKLEFDFVGLFFGRTKNGDGELRNVVIQIERKENGTDPNWLNPIQTTETLSNKVTDPVRKTVTVDLTDHTKKWDVRMRRKAALHSNGRIDKRTTDQGVTWSALRTFQANTADATGRTRLALKIKASGQLQGRIERLSALVKQKAPTWNGTAWSSANQITSNPADIFRWFVKGVRADGRLVAGLGLPDTRIDETSIRAWRTWCNTEELKCDAVLTGSQSVADVLNMICRCGRASASWASGKLGVVFDQANLAPTAMITPGNIIAGTMEVNYADGRLADEIVVRYIDPDFDWQPAELRRLKAGVTAPSRTATVTLQGIASRAQAKEETNLIAARQKYHRRRITWEMGPEGLTIGRGDVVQVTSDLLSGGTTGRLRPGGTAASPVLNQEVNIKRGVNYMVFRLLDGTLHTSTVTKPGGGVGATSRPVLQTPLPGLPDNGGLAAAPVEKGAVAGDVLWRHYDSETPPRKLKIIEIEPRAMDRYRFTAIDEVTEYYDAADLELTDPLPDLKYRGPRVIACALSERQIQVAEGFANEITANLTVAGDWRGGVIRARRTPDPDARPPVVERWRVVAVLDESQTSASWIDQPFGSLEIVVVPGSLVAPAGPAHPCHAFTLSGDQDAPDPPANLLVTGVTGGWTAIWNKPTEPDYSLTELRDGAQTLEDGARAALRGTVKATVFTRIGLAAATPLRVFVRHLDASGNPSAWAKANVTTLAPAQAGADGEPGADGAAGEAGSSVQLIYHQTAANSSPSLPVSNPVDSIPSGWDNSPQGVTSAVKYEWVSQRTGRTGAWSAWSAPVLYNQHPSAGRNPGTYFVTNYDRSVWSDAAANNATPGDNVLTDLVMLSNPAETSKFSEMRSWDGARWVQIHTLFSGNYFFDGSIHARKLVVANLRALGVTVVEADIEGTLTAARLHSNVFNVNTLWGGGSLVKQFANSSDSNARADANYRHSIRLASPVSGWDSLLLFGKVHYDKSMWNSAIIPGKALVSGTLSSRPGGSNHGAVRSVIIGGSSGSEAFEFYAWRSADNNYLHLQRAGSNEKGEIWMVFGIKRPGVNSGGGSAPAPPPTPTTRVPGIPRSARAVAGQSQITLSWLAPSDAGTSLITGYDVQKRTASSSTFDALIRATGGGAARSHAFTGLTAGTAVEARVRAVSNAGAGDWSRWRRATPTAPPILYRGNFTSGQYVENGRTHTGWFPTRSAGGIGSQRKVSGSLASPPFYVLLHEGSTVSVWFNRNVAADGGPYTTLTIGSTPYDFEDAEHSIRSADSHTRFYWNASGARGGIAANRSVVQVTLT